MNLTLALPLWGFISPKLMFIWPIFKSFEISFILINNKSPIPKWGVSSMNGETMIIYNIIIIFNIIITFSHDKRNPKNNFKVLFQ